MSKDTHLIARARSLSLSMLIKMDDTILKLYFRIVSSRLISATFNEAGAGIASLACADGWLGLVAIVRVDLHRQVKWKTLQGRLVAELFCKWISKWRQDHYLRDCEIQECECKRIGGRTHQTWRVVNSLSRGVRVERPPRTTWCRVFLWNFKDKQNYLRICGNIVGCQNGGIKDKWHTQEKMQAELKVSQGGRSNQTDWCAAALSFHPTSLTNHPISWL